MQLFAGELTNQNREYYKVNDNGRYWMILSDIKHIGYIIWVLARNTAIWY